MTLAQWKAEFLRDLQVKKIWVCTAAANFIANPKKAGSKKAYIKGVKSFLRGHSLPEELATFTKITDEKPKVVKSTDPKKDKVDKTTKSTKADTKKTSKAKGA